MRVEGAGGREGGDRAHLPLLIFPPVQLDAVKDVLENGKAAAVVRGVSKVCVSERE